jgi:hypothetical protein
MPMVNSNQFSLDKSAIRQKIEDYLLNNKPRLHQQKKKCGQLQSYLDLTAQEATKIALNLIHQGMNEDEAWNLAVRQEINRTESNNRQSFY